MLALVLLAVKTTEAEEWKSGVVSGGQRAKLTKQNSGGERNYRAPAVRTLPKKYYRKTTRYWKYSGADNQGKLEHITESESNYIPRDRYQKW